MTSNETSSTDGLNINFINCYHIFLQYIYRDKLYKMKLLVIFTIVFGAQYINCDGETEVMISICIHFYYLLYKKVVKLIYIA